MSGPIRRNRYATIRLTLIDVVESRKFKLLAHSEPQSRAVTTDLKPWGLYAILAHWIIYAEARLPIPNASTGGSGTTFNLLPVWMNVLDAVDGSSLKPITAS